jgi:hypothetical protein
MADLPAPLPRITRELVADLQRSLEGELVGAYLYGSAITGGFEAELSDLDVCVVTRDSVDALALDVFAGIVDRLAERERAWADRLDVVFIGQPTLARFRDGGPLLSISHDEPLQRYRDADDWLQTWYLVRLAGRPLIGSPVETVVPSIEAEDFVAAVARDADRIVARALALEAAAVQDGLLAYTLLTLARVLRALDDRSVVSKSEAGTWLARRTPRWRSAIEPALAVRRDPDRRAFTEPERERVRDAIREAGREIEIRRARPGSARPGAPAG